MHRRQALFELADRQAGYFTAAQARALGYSDRAIHYHKRRGEWIPVGWGLYRLRAYPVSPEEELVRLTLWSRNRKGEPQAVVSHETALRLYGLTDLVPEHYHLTVPFSFRKRPPAGVVLHRARLREGEYREHAGYRVTTPLRTLLDVAAGDLSPEHLAAAVEEALARGLVRRARLEAALREQPGRVRERLLAALAEVR